MAIVPGSGSTLADYIVPARPSRTSSIVRDGSLVVGASLLMALSARVQIPLDPVPFTFQMLVVMLTAAALGSWRATLAMLLYLAEGAGGLAVFAHPPYGGALYFLTPTAGYLWSYPLAAFVVGWLCEQGLDRSFLTSVLAMLPGLVIIYGIGVPWLAIVLHIDLAQAFRIGMLLFIPGDLAKLVVASALLPVAWRVVRSIRSDLS